MKIEGLLIDIDDTIIREKTNGGDGMSNTGSLFDVLREAGTKLGKLSQKEAAKIIADVKENVEWWSWDDFIKALGLDEDEFWEYAYEYESKYIEPTGEDIIPALRRLRKSGLSLFITSNNPNSGIRHKLRLGGIDYAEAEQLFAKYLGATEMRNMKWDKDYWLKVPKETGLPAINMATIGDTLRDDHETPQSAGMGHSFIINRKKDNSSENTSRLTYVTNFTQIADCLS